MAHQEGITLESYLREEQKKHHGATGELTGLLIEIAHAAKVIAREVSKAGLVDILGLTGKVNVQGEEVMKLDAFAHHTIVRSLDHTGLVALMASEEAEGVIDLDPRYTPGKYVLGFDPLDGSSNIDVCAAIGSIFSIHRRVTSDGKPGLADALQPGLRQVAAAYVLYGPSVVLVLSTGQGVHEFTLDPSVGTFYLSDEEVKIPPRGKTYSVNEGNEAYWHPGQRRYMQALKGVDRERGRPYGARYQGTLVADLHRTIKKGGIFMYPADTKDAKKRHGKLRLLFEAAPLAFLVQGAGGYASDGRRSILEVEPGHLHARTPLYIGSAEDVREAESYVRDDPAGAEA